MALAEKEPVEEKNNKGFVGLGLRRELLTSLKAQKPSSIDFFELAPENWIGIGGKLRKQFQDLAQRYSMICHGLSLSLGGPDPLDKNLLRQIKKFLNEYQIDYYSEHLSYCSDQGQLYDLLPIPFTEKAVRYVAKRIRQTQEILERRIAIENISYYVTPPLKEMDELHFIQAVLEEADCKLLLDVNNVYVNSVNHRYDPHEFLKGIPSGRIAYLHIAGHYNEAPYLAIDTHGAPVIKPVWNLLEETYRLFGVTPTLLERDFNFPPLEKLLSELKHIRRLQEEGL
jgi:uncharacterized protein (UPF0276 family)